MTGQPNIERSNNPQVVTGGEFGVVIDGGTAGNGTLPLVIDSTNNKMYFYSGSAWVALN